MQQGYFVAMRWASSEIGWEISERKTITLWQEEMDAVSREAVAAVARSRHGVHAPKTSKMMRTSSYVTVLQESR